MRVFSFAVAMVLVACTAPAQAEPNPQDVVAAERAFAGDAATRGWAFAFRSHHAEGAIILQPDPVEAAATLAGVEGDGHTNLDWRPAYAGISLSGDLGFTTGPFLFRDREGVVGHYFTVWQKQADGMWKWIFDAGTDVVDPDPVGLDYAVPTLTTAVSGAGSAVAAIVAVAAIEDKATLDDLVAHLSPEARVHRVGSLRAIGQGEAQALMRSDGAVTFHGLRREASSAGDLVFSLGEVRDQHEGAERLRYFARIWQLQDGGWRIVFDEIVPRRV